MSFFLVVGALLSGCLFAASGVPEHVERVTVAVRTPNPCWKIAIRSIHRRDGTLLVVSELLPPPEDAFCAQVIAEAKETIGVRTEPPEDVRHLVLGRTWSWGESAEGTVFVESSEELDRLLEGAEPLATFKDDGRPDT